MFGGAYRGRSVFVTGHTGFKGAWLTQWLLDLGAAVTGYALEPTTAPSLFDAAGLDAGGQRFVDVRADIRNREALAREIERCRPDFLFHLAAQPLVRRSYALPHLTFETNVMGTVNVLDTVREVNVQGHRIAVVIVTSDKCYENQETGETCSEGNPLGGFDPYSSSKACSELVTASFARSFFGAAGDVAVASARAGNVIGGGDWADERIIPDCARALSGREPVVIRNADAVRPWQHVLESLSGYLALGAALWRGDPAVVGAGGRGGHAWNFGPTQESHVTVRAVADLFIEAWGEGSWIPVEGGGTSPHEANLLALDSRKAASHLGWRPSWTIREAVEATAHWYRRYYRSDIDAAALCRADIATYCEAARRGNSSWAVPGGAE